MSRAASHTETLSNEQFAERFLDAYEANNEEAMASLIRIATTEQLNTPINGSSLPILCCPDGMAFDTILARSDLDINATTEYSSRTAIFEALKRPERVEKLLSTDKIDLNYVADGKTILEEAVYILDSKSVKLLLEKGAEITDKIKAAINTPLFKDATNQARIEIRTTILEKLATTETSDTHTHEDIDHLSVGAETTTADAGTPAEEDTPDTHTTSDLLGDIAL